MEEIEVPQFFICPISLHIMKDPVTTITGISYDRESIEQWLKTAKEATCPVTKQPLPRNFDLTSNHTLRRLIQAWCTQNAIDRIPTPKSALNKDQVLRLVRDLNVDRLRISTLKKMEALVMENERNRKSMEEAAVVKAMVTLIIRCYSDHNTTGLGQGLRILSLVWSQSNENKALVNENYDLITSSLMWVLRLEDIDSHIPVKTNAVIVLRMVLEVASTSLLESLNLEFFKQIVRLLRGNLSQQASKSALHVLIVSCPWGRNKLKIVEANAVFELIELELEKPQKCITELIFNLLAQLCSFADGRFHFLKHSGAIAMVAKRILRVSAATDDRGVHILSSISKFCATNEVILEMLSVGAVTKLCMVTQADCEKYLKEKAKEILRLHSNVWNNSPCIAVYLLTRYQR
ncbi:RING-type E3 ubiquitin transferase [Melia azedarach]|uniref:RING-type E3 ubiquitin transferase n=1 Tax=Melia azedarach TaxID=155640 RepID=A0ACC1YP02_MELAZ|nr:RING-type E3 ubiquitin transferase [Melia azedarach]